jgi:hypothetical protein
MSFAAKVCKSLLFALFFFCFTSLKAETNSLNFEYILFYEVIFFNGSSRICYVENTTAKIYIIPNDRERKKLEANPQLWATLKPTRTRKIRWNSFLSLKSSPLNTTLLEALSNNNPMDEYKLDKTLQKVEGERSAFIWARTAESGSAFKRIYERSRDKESRYPTNYLTWVSLLEAVCLNDDSYEKNEEFDRTLTKSYNNANKTSP